MLLYNSYVANPSIPNTLYAFHEQSEREIMIEEHVPFAVQNNYGENVYQHNLDSGWIDITHARDLLPVTIQMWLVQNA